MPRFELLSSFVVRVVHAEDKVRITVQNVKTRQMFELTSWCDLVWVLQQLPIPSSPVNPMRRRKGE